MIKQPNNSNYLTSYKILFSLGCILFTVATIFTLPFSIMSQF